MNEFPINLSLWVQVLNLAVSVATLVFFAWLYRRISESQIDDNIMNATNSILALLEKAKTLQARERRLLVDWLNGWEYFTPRSKRHKPEKESFDHLKKYFDELAAND